MCGIAGYLNTQSKPLSSGKKWLHYFCEALHHRGPDGSGSHAEGPVGLAHTRLSIIDLDHGAQPMRGVRNTVVTFNGEIYNHPELRKELSDYPFSTNSDTEVILAAYQKWGEECVSHFRGMFAFALWDPTRQVLFCARDRFGIKPFYYTEVEGTFLFASTAQALLPFLPEIETDRKALQEYLHFQIYLEEETLFKGIKQLPAAHTLTISTTNVNQSPKRYWEVYYNLDFDHTASYFSEKLESLLVDAVNCHCRSDVPIGSYVSGGVDSSLVASIANTHTSHNNKGFVGFTGKFAEEGCDESEFARAAAQMNGFPLKEITMSSQDFADSIVNVIKHLDYPIAGPGSFPQYHVSKLVGQSHKVVLGGQGGDEIFGGYTRYLIAYFEQCIKAAIDGTANSGKFVVTYESIIPNLQALRNYKPLLQQFWSNGLFGELDQRYYQLINRSPSIEPYIDWSYLPSEGPFAAFQRIFNSSNVGHESYFDKMTHFDFKTLLPALLHVEDRMSMAHGVESRVPFLDHSLVEFAATIPSDIKFKDGTLKMLLIKSMQQYLPKEIVQRKDKMGFPVPLNEWFSGPLNPFVNDILSSAKARGRPYIKDPKVLSTALYGGKFSRSLWGLFNLEVWQNLFHDRAPEIRRTLQDFTPSLPEPILTTGVST